MPRRPRSESSRAVTRRGALLGALAGLGALLGCGGPRPPAAHPPAGSPAGSPTLPTDRQPYRQLRHQAIDYPGPGREEPEPEGLEEIRLGWFGPSAEDDPLNGGLWIAASVAVEAANRAGGDRGLPYRLVPRWSEDPWGSGVSRVVRLAYEERVWAILGSVDGPATHLAEQVVAKARLPLVSAVSGDKSVQLAGVAWMFTCCPSDDTWAPLLVDALLAAPDVAERGFVLASTTDHDARLARRDIERSLSRRGRAPELHREAAPGDSGFEGIRDALRRARPAALLIVAGPIDAARLVRLARADGFTGAILGPPWLARHAFRERGGPAAEGVRFPWIGGPADHDAETRAFIAAFRARAGRSPDPYETLVRDATRLLIEAVRLGGRNRARIRDALVALAPWRGAAGRVEWDPTGQNRRRVHRMAEVRGGAVRILPRNP